MIIGLLTLIITFTPAVEWAGRPLASPWTNVDQGVLILLSSTDVTLPGPPPNMVIGYSTYWRAVHAIHVWRHGHFRTLLISGQGTEETIKPFLVAYGIPASAILVENAATNTHENALYSKRILERIPGPYVLLTSDYHMYRASRCFRHEGVAVETMPAPDLFKLSPESVNRWPLFWALSHEYSGIGYYRFRGWM
jgi:uncharacterized SAM-binding protein YcdF (DUF218 family)